MLRPFYIKAFISWLHGVAIEMVKTSKEYVIKVDETHREVEEVVLPRLSKSDNALFSISGSFNVIEGLNIISEEFYNRYHNIIDNLSRATNFIIDTKKLGLVVKLLSGDVKLINVSVAYRRGKYYEVKKIWFMWLFENNTRKNFKDSLAKEHVILDVRRYLYKLMPRTPIEVIMDTVKEYESLIKRKDVKEEDLIEFLYHNPFIIVQDCIRVEKKPHLNHDVVPDFVILTATGELVIVEL